MSQGFNRRKFIASMGVILPSFCLSKALISKEILASKEILTAFDSNKLVAHEGILVPKREFGNTGVKISKLCLGGSSLVGKEAQDLLDQALSYNVDCWEITSFNGKTYGDYLKRNAGVRERVFLTGKVYSTDPTVMQNQLDKLLSDNNISCVDFLAIHQIDNPYLLTDAVRKWAEKVKSEKKVRFFGFCTHKNTINCINSGADLGWVDGIQTVYNYRMQRIKGMEDALKKCYDKGIGIIAVKSMGLSVLKSEELQKLPLSEEKLNSQLARYDATFEQAKLKSIWQNPALTSICSLMPSAAILESNATAAMDDGILNNEIKKILEDYAACTDRFYCRRCGSCDGANADSIPIFNIMEILMYMRGYGNDMKLMARKLFEKIPIEIRKKMNSSDYSAAEKNCPQKMPVAQLMKEAYSELSVD